MAGQVNTVLLKDLVAGNYYQLEDQVNVVQTASMSNAKHQELQTLINSIAQSSFRVVRNGFGAFGGFTVQIELNGEKRTIPYRIFPDGKDTPFIQVPPPAIGPAAAPGVGGKRKSRKSKKSRKSRSKSRKNKN